jgi:hypothetical protein
LPTAPGGGVWWFSADYEIALAQKAWKLTDSDWEALPLKDRARIIAIERSERRRAAYEQTLH